MALWTWQSLHSFKWIFVLHTKLDNDYETHHMKLIEASHSSFFLDMKTKINGMSWFRKNMVNNKIQEHHREHPLGNVRPPVTRIRHPMHWWLHPRAAPSRVRQGGIKSHHGKQKSDHLYRLIVHIKQLIGQKSSKVGKRSITVVPIIMLAMHRVHTEILFSSACTHVPLTVNFRYSWVHPVFKVGGMYLRVWDISIYVYIMKMHTWQNI